MELWAARQRQRVESLLTESSALGRITQAALIAFDDARRGFAANPCGDTTEPPEIAAEVNTRVFGPMLRDLIVQGNDSGELHVKDPEMTAAFAVALGVEAVLMMRDDASGRVEEAALEAMRRLVAGVVT